MYHEVPAGAFGDHGLISYNPKFFNRLCYCNGYRTLLRKDEPCVIRTALIKRSRRPFATPLDLPEVLMPKPPFDVRSVLSQIPGSSAWPWIKRTLRNAGLS
jgi:hypothetical protein